MGKKNALGKGAVEESGEGKKNQSEERRAAQQTSLKGRFSRKRKVPQKSSKARGVICGQGIWQAKNISN